jgi:hypothetical protein
MTGEQIGPGIDPPLNTTTPAFIKLEPYSGPMWWWGDGSGPPPADAVIHRQNEIIHALLEACRLALRQIEDEYPYIAEDLRAAIAKAEDANP